MTEGQQNRNRRRFPQRRRGNNTNKNNSNANNNQPRNGIKPKERELKFYMHDSHQRKTSESFNKIKDNQLILS